MWHPRRMEVGMHDIAPSLYVQKVFFTEVNIHNGDSVQTGGGGGFRKENTVKIQCGISEMLQKVPIWFGMFLTISSYAKSSRSG